MIELRYGQPLPSRDFQIIEEMDAEIYGADIFTCPGLANERFRRCPDFFVTALDGPRLVGAWSTYPVKPGLWEKVLASGHMLDDDVDPDFIVPLSRERPNDLMAFDLVVDPAYRGRGIANQIMEGYRLLIRRRQEEGYSFRRLFGYVITPMGYHVMKRYGAKLVRPVDEGQLFSIDLDAFLRQGAVPGRVPPPPANLTPLGGLG